MKKKTNHILHSLIGSLFLSTAPGMVEAVEAVDLESITVKGEGMPEAARSFSVHTIGSDVIHSRNWDQALRFIEEVPGMDLGAYQQGGVADVFTIRGFTGAGHGSDAGVSLDGISLNEGESHADGYADTNTIIPLEIDTLTVYKGPVSPLYGNFARGGVLAFNTRKGGEYQDVSLSFGQFETFDAQAAFGGMFGPVQLNMALQGYDSEGWREHSRYTKSNASIRGSYDLTDATEMAVTLRGHGGQWDAPGYIPESQFEDDDTRRQQAVNAEDDGGEKQYYAERVDINHTISDNLKLLAFLYSTQQDFTRFAKFGYTPGGQTERFYSREAMALGGSLNGNGQIMGYDSTWVLGLEYYDEETDWLRWNTSNRVRVNPTEDRDFTIDTTSIFGQADIDVSPHFRPTLGFRYDSFGGSYDNQDPGGTPFSEDMGDYDHFSPKLGFRSKLTDQWELRGSAANGFGLPDGPAKYDPSLDVDAIEYWQYEIGINGAPSPQWYFDAAAFLMNSSDEILEDPPGSGTFRNVGETDRTGIEGEIRYFPASVNYLEYSVLFSFYDSEIVENPDPTLEGNQIALLPEHIATVAVAYEPPVGWGGALRWRSVGSYPLDDANTEEYDGYDIVNASVFYNFQGNEGRKLRWFFDINNLTDEVYSETALIIGVPSYTPRPPISFMTGIKISM